MRVRFVVVVLGGVLLITASVAAAADIRGKVTSALGGEPLARVQVSLLDTNLQDVTSSAGGFTITGANPGQYTLRLSAVGYRLVTIPLSITTCWWK